MKAGRMAEILGSLDKDLEVIFMPASDAQKDKDGNFPIDGATATKKQFILISNQALRQD